MKDLLLKEIYDYDPNSLLYKYLCSNYNEFTLANYVDFVAKHEDCPALCHVDRKGKKTVLSFKELSEMSNQMANYLRDKGVKKGDIVALILRNNIEFFGLVLAIQKLGGVVMPLQYTNKQKQYQSIFGRANPTCIIAEDYEIKQSKNESAFILEEINNSVKDDVLKLCVNKSSPNSKDWEDMDLYKQYSKEFNNTRVNIDDFGYLFTTSGTTGEPKLVMHNYGFGLSHFFTGQWYGVKKGEKHFTPCDSSWAMASWNMSAVLLHQGILYINDYDRFDAKELLDCISQENIYSLCAPRALLKRFVETIGKNPGILKNNIKSLSSAGELLTQKDKEIINRCFGVKLKEGYGMTEAVLPIYETDDGLWKKSPLYDAVELVKSSGFDDYEIVIFGSNLGLLKGYLLSNNEYVEYLSPPVVNQKVVWHTSDMGRRDDKGNICCAGRFGSNLKTDDCLINLLDVEEVIKSHPGVYNCVVESQPDDISGYALIAYVELTDDNLDVTENDIKNFVKSQMPNYYRPKYVVFKKIPRTLNEKNIHNYNSAVPDKNMSLTRKKHQ